MEKKKPAQVFHFDLYGKREDKYDFLSNNAMETITWQTLQPQEPELFFVPKDFEVKGEYDNGFTISELFNISSTGVLTAKDSITIDIEKEVLFERVTDIKNNDEAFLKAKYSIDKESDDWSISNAKKDLILNYSKDYIVDYNYRPFDKRNIYYTNNHRGFIAAPRTKVMKHVHKKDNFQIVSCRQIATNNWCHIFVCKDLFDDSFVSNKSKERGYSYPLYLYPETTTQQSLLNEVVRTPNLNMEIVDEIAKGLGIPFVAEKDLTGFENLSGLPKNVAPIDILDYIYAVLHSPSYREKYKEFLKIDFPRVPYPSPLTPKGGIEETQEKFWKLVALGSALRQIHLLGSPVVEQYITGYPEDGDNVVIKPHFVISTQEKSHKESDTKCDASLRQHNKTGRVYINSTQYFNNVPEVAWNFYIGGYQPAQKWLKDRKDRELGFEDILHYQKIIVALSETDRIMKEIDKIEI